MYPQLSSFQIENFKAFRAAHVPIRPITLIYGQNSAGKSSIIDFLLWLAHLGRIGVPIGFPNELHFDLKTSGSSLHNGPRFGVLHWKLRGSNTASVAAAPINHFQRLVEAGYYDL